MNDACARAADCYVTVKGLAAGGRCHLPSLVYDDAPAAIEWLCRAFGFTRRLIIQGENGTIRHSELSLGTGVIMVRSTRLAEGRVGPRRLQGGTAHGLSVRVSDPDAHQQRAVAAGARIVRPLKDEPHGARGYMAEDAVVSPRRLVVRPDPRREPPAGLCGYWLRAADGRLETSGDLH